MFGVYFWVCLYPAVPVMYLDGKELALCLGVFLLAAGVSSYPPQGSTFPRSFSHPPRPAASLLPAREEGWSGSLGAWQIGEG